MSDLCWDCNANVVSTAGVRCVECQSRESPLCSNCHLTEVPFTGDRCGPCVAALLQIPLGDSEDKIPAHYKRGGVVGWDVIEAWGLNYNLGNALNNLDRGGIGDRVLDRVTDVLPDNDLVTSPLGPSRDDVAVPVTVKVARRHGQESTVLVGSGGAGLALCE